MSDLTKADLDAVLADPRHLGWGYARVREEHNDVLVDLVDQAVLEQANRYGMNRELLFVWANSKYGRWLSDMLFDISQVDPQAPGVDAIPRMVARFMNGQVIVDLAAEESAKR